MADKQTQLVSTIADALHVKLGPEFVALSTAIAKLNVSIQSVIARIEMIEHMANTGGAAPKKAVRTAAAAGAKKAAAGKGEVKIPSNALLFFRLMLEQDIDEARHTWCTDENIAMVETNATVAKAAKDKDKSDEKLGTYFSAVGAQLWTQLLSKEDKEEIKAKFLAWKEARERDAGEAPLEADEIAEE